MPFNVFNADQPGWKDALKRIPHENSDINFLPEWYQTWQDHEQATPKCIVAEIEGILFVYPFFLKPINGYDLDKTYYDIQTAYGYGGVITSQTNVPDSAIDRFNQQVNNWLIENDVVAEFIREHPLLNHCRRDAEYIKVRKNVYVEPSQDYRIPEKKTRQRLAKTLNDKVLSVIIDEKLEYLDDFVSLYNLNTSRLNMNKYYLFPDGYFAKVKTLLHDKTRLIHIVYKEKIISSGLFFSSGNKGTLHLAASDFEYQALRGNDMLFYSAVLQSYNLGLDILSIGGGISAKDDDNLFRFKKKFSDIHKDVMIGKKIINQPVYNRLVDQWRTANPDLEVKYKDFFLKYRQTANDE